MADDRLDLSNLPAVIGTLRSLVEDVRNDSDPISHEMEEAYRCLLSCLGGLPRPGDADQIADSPLLDRQTKGMLAKLRSNFRNTGDFYCNLTDSTYRLDFVALLDKVCNALSAPSEALSAWLDGNLTRQQITLFRALYGKREVALASLCRSVWRKKSHPEHSALESTITRINKKLVDMPQHFAIHHVHRVRNALQLIVLPRQR
jgi:hypothetical protein